MSKEKSPARESRKQAEEWCKQVRGLLKLRKKSLLKRAWSKEKKKSTGDSKRLDKAWESLASKLKDLEKTDPELAEDWATNAAKVLKREPGAPDNHDVARAQMLQLETLGAQLDWELALLDKRNVDATVAKFRETKEQNEAEATEILNEALSAAERTLGELRKLDADPHLFSTRLEELIGTARKAARSDGALAALKLLAHVNSVHDEAIENANKFHDCRKRLAAAELQWADVADWAAMVDAGSFRAALTAVESARVAFESLDSESFQDAASELDLFDKHVKQLLKQMAPEDLAAYKALRSARQEFDKAVSKAEETRSRLAELRGIDPTKVLASFGRLLTDAVADVESLNDAESVASRTEQLESALKQAEKEAEQTSKDARKRHKADLKHRGKWEQAAQRAGEALAAVRQLPGASAEAEELRQRIEAARGCIEAVRGPGGVESENLSWGYVDALKTLGDFESILTAAAEKSAALMSAPYPPELTAPIQAIEVALSQLGLVAPDSWTATMREDFVAQLGDIQASFATASDLPASRKSAVATLTSFHERLVADVERRQQERTQAEEGEARAIESMYEFQAREVPLTQYAAELRKLQATQTTEMADREWDRAAENFAEIVSAAKSRLDKFEKFGAQWDAAQRVHANAKALAPKLLGWPPAATAANKLLEAVRAVERVDAETHDPEEALQAHSSGKVDALYESLLGVANVMPFPADQKAINDALRLGGDQLRNACQELRGGLLRKLETKLADLADSRGTTLHNRLDKLENSWDDFRSDLFKALPQPFDPKPPLKLIAAQLAQKLLAVEQLKREVQTLLDDKPTLEAFKSQARLAEVEKQAGNPDERFERLFATMTLLGVDAGEIAAARAEYARAVAITAGGGKPKDQTSALEKLESDLLVKIGEARDQAHQSRADSRKRLDGLEKKLKSNARDHKRYEAYFDQLRAQSEDVKSLLDADDPYLATQAVELLNELGTRISDLKESKGDNPRDYRQTNKLIDKLSGKLGADTGRIVEQFLKDTYADLYAKLTDAIVVARSSAPSDAYDTIAALEQPINDAVDEAQRRKDAYERLQVRVDELSKRWSKLRKELIDSLVDKAKAKIFEPAPALAKHLEARFDEAKALQKKQGDAATANKLLDDVAAMLADLEAASDKPNALRQQESRCAQEQRRVRDLVSQFNSEADVIEKQLIPAVKTQLKSMEDGDEGLVAGLERMLKSAKAVVKPYRNIFSKNPFKDDEKAPRLQKAEADFRSAYELIGQLRLSADRMLSHSVTTNVTNAGDLKKVQKDWIAQASHFAKTLREMAGAIRAVAAEVKGLTEGDALPDEERAQFEADAKAAGTLVDKLAARFRADAFSRDIAEMGKVDSDGRKKVREQLLRRMREVRGEVLKNPLLSKLRSDRNPFGGEKVMAALAYVRASLKRIELAALEGV